MTKILMVCLGNICRSPLAEEILKSKLPKEGFQVDSAGTGDYHIGDPPDPRSIKTAQNYDLDISQQRGRQFQAEDFDTYDVIYAMDESNYQNIKKLARNDKDRAKVKMILNEIYPGQNYNVPDPYHGQLTDFDHVFKLLDEACEVAAKKLTQ